VVASVVVATVVTEVVATVVAREVVATVVVATVVAREAAAAKVLAVNSLRAAAPSVTTAASPIKRKKIRASMRMQEFLVSNEFSFGASNICSIMLFLYPCKESHTSRPTLQQRSSLAFSQKALQDVGYWLALVMV